MRNKHASIVAQLLLMLLGHFSQLVYNLNNDLTVILHHHNYVKNVDAPRDVSVILSLGLTKHDYVSVERCTVRH